jgi:dihydroneopterin aldolase
MNFAATLTLHELKVGVRLGWSPEERRRSQEVLLEIDLGFESLPRACESDKLEDTIGYDGLAAHIAGFCEQHEFRLIEHLGFRLLQEIRTQLRPGMHARLRVTKLRPPMAISLSAASFRCGEGPWLELS